MMKNRNLNKLWVGLVIALVFSSICIYRINTKEANVIYIANHSKVENKNVSVVFKGTHNEVLELKEKISIPEQFEGGIYLQIKSSDGNKEYIIKSYYGFYMKECIKATINDSEDSEDAIEVIVNIK